MVYWCFIRRNINHTKIKNIKEKLRISVKAISPYRNSLLTKEVSVIYDKELLLLNIYEKKYLIKKGYKVDSFSDEDNKYIKISVPI